MDKQSHSKKKVYVFTFDNSGLNPNDFIDWTDIELEPIPQKILEIIGDQYDVVYMLNAVGAGRAGEGPSVRVGVGTG
jgi:hypothetical protein